MFISPDGKKFYSRRAAVQAGMEDVDQGHANRPDDSDQGHGISDSRPVEPEPIQDVTCLTFWHVVPPFLPATWRLPGYRG